MFGTFPSRQKNLVMAMGAWIRDPTPEARSRLQRALKNRVEYVSSYLDIYDDTRDNVQYILQDLKLISEVLQIFNTTLRKEQKNESSTSEAEEVDSQEERQSVPEGGYGVSHEQVPVPHLHWEDPEVSYTKHNPETDGGDEARVKIEKPLFYHLQTACFIRPGDYIEIDNVSYLVVVVSLMLENLVELTMDTSGTTEDACTVATLIVHSDQVLKIANDTRPRKM